MYIYGIDVLQNVFQIPLESKNIIILQCFRTSLKSILYIRQEGKLLFRNNGKYGK